MIQLIPALFVYHHEEINKRLIELALRVLSFLGDDFDEIVVAQTLRLVASLKNYIIYCEFVRWLETSWHWKMVKENNKNNSFIRRVIFFINSVRTFIADKEILLDRFSVCKIIDYL